MSTDSAKRRGVRAVTLSALASVALLLTACSSDITTIEQAEAQVVEKQQAVLDAQDAFVEASDAFCRDAADYVVALDQYGDVLRDTAPTVGDVREAGADLAAPRDDAFDGAEAAVAAQQELYTAQQELADAQATLDRFRAGASGAAAVEPSAVPEPAPLAPAETVQRVQQAEKDFASTVAQITDDTPLAEASESFKSAAVGLELAWMRLFVDAGCATDEQIVQATGALTTFTMALQQDLANAGYYTGAIDGIVGPLTTSAIEALQEANGLPVTGVLDKASIDALQQDLIDKGIADADASLVSTSALQQTLKLLGFWDAPVDGIWTEDLTEALKECQVALGVEPTGVVDAATIAAFQAGLALIEWPEPLPSPSPEPTVSPSVEPLG